jgi:hypothetical protein
MEIHKKLIGIAIDTSLTRNMVEAFLSQNEITCNPNVKVIGILGNLIPFIGFMSSAFPFYPVIREGVVKLIHPNVVFLLIDCDLHSDHNNPFTVIDWRNSIDMPTEWCQGGYKVFLDRPTHWEDFIQRVS